MKQEVMLMKWVVLIVGLICIFVGVCGLMVSDPCIENGVIVDKGMVTEYIDEYGQRHGGVYWFVIDDLEGCRWTKYVSPVDWTTHWVGSRYNLRDAVMYFGDEGIWQDYQGGYAQNEPYK